MRSQATKPLPKKGALSKTAKTATAAKQAKKKAASPKKVKNLVNKSLVKKPKKAASKDDIASDGDTTSSDKNDTSTETIKSGPSKANASRSNSPTKKAKKEPKEKKDTSKSPPGSKNVVVKKIVKPTKKPKLSTKKGVNDNDDIKYKINLDVAKKVKSRFSKAKTIVKKSNANQKKIGTPQKKQEKGPQDKNTTDDKEKSNDKNENTEDNAKLTEANNDTQDSRDEKKEESKPENYKSSGDAPNISDPNTNLSANTQPETPKVETERPPKFFTSTRSPRMVDIDVKCFKTSKGNLSVSERFLSLKCETKTDDSNKDKNSSNTLVSQGPDIDVYTFTEKVDSPKSILSDFRSPINKNIGRVRPIARVKGTVIDKKTESEKKKYSPHRPIEEVVQQLKANKRSEELTTTTQNENSQSTTSVESSASNNEKESEDKPTPIVSKSYKMVARKSSVTGKPFSPIKFLDQEPSSSKTDTNNAGTATKKAPSKAKKQQKKTTLSDDELDTCKFSLNPKTFHYSSSEESVSESNDDNDTKESSGSDAPKNKKTKNKKYKRITDSAKKTTSKELKELSKDSLVDLKDDSIILGDKPSKRRLKLLSMWTGPKKHRMASLNAIAKVHCLYENESRTHMELGLMKTVDRQPIPSTSKVQITKKKDSKSKETEKQESTSESEYENRKDSKNESSESSDDNPPSRTLRGVPGIRSAGKYWDPKSSTSSSEDSELESKKKINSPEKKKAPSKPSTSKSDTEKPPAKMKKTAGVPVKKKRNRNEVVMDLKDMVVQKRMASLNATAILAASYEKRSPKSNKDDTTSDSCSDESFSQKSKNGVNSGVKSEIKHEDTKKEIEETVMTDSKQKVEVIVNQDTDVTITGVYSTHHHEGFCTVSHQQYRISSTSHTQTTSTANCEKEGCPRDEARYTPLSALSSMQPPAEHAHGHPHPVADLGGLSRRAGCSSAFSAPSPAAHHDPAHQNLPSSSAEGTEDPQSRCPVAGKPSACSLCDSAARSSPLGYYQPAGPMIKETSADADRALARYHPPHYHAPHPPVLQQYGPPYYTPDLCYGRYYRPPGPYHMPPQPDAQMVGVGSEPYPPQYYGTPPCYQHSPQRIPPYVEYRGCPCPLNACPKNVLIGPATGKAPTGGGPADVPSALAPPGGAFRTKVRACALDTAADTHGSGKDPPLEQEPPAAADAPHPCPLPAIGGASPKRELLDNIRLVGDMSGPGEALGPPSPARGSAGACAPQPPPSAPRRARLGKEMARKSLVLADTGQLMSTPQQPPPAHHSDADDDVMAISPPTCAPIDLSSSDERSTPLVDVKKENEGPTCAAPRKPDAQALREHNCTSSVQESPENNEPKAVKRRYSRPKLEIDMKDTQLEESCKTNGIGEHVKLQKRRKVSGDQTTTIRTETITKEAKKKATQNGNKRSPKNEKKPVKRKLDNSSSAPKAKRMLLGASADAQVKDVIPASEDMNNKPKIKSALILDNLIRKNSIDRVDAKGYSSDKELNPAELFLSPSETISQNASKKTLNINNNIVENNVPVSSGVRPNTIAAVSQLIEKKLACKKMEKVDSKVTQSLKSVLKTPTDKLKHENPTLSSAKCKTKSEKNSASVESSDIKDNDISKDKSDLLKDNLKDCDSVSNSVAVDDGSKSTKVSKTPKPKVGLTKNDTKTKPTDESHKEKSTDVTKEATGEKDASKTEKSKRKFANNNGQMKNKSIEKVAKLLQSKKPVTDTETNDLKDENADSSKEIVEVHANTDGEKTISDKAPVKRCKANGEMQTKSIEMVAKLLGSKKPATQTEDATPAVEDSDKRPSTDAAVDTETHKPDKILPKRCKLTNGEMKEEKKKKVEKVVKLLVSKKPAIKADEATQVVEDACASSPIPSLGRRTKRRRSGAGTRRVRRPPLYSPLVPPSLEHRHPPRWSNGWQWDGEHYLSKVYLNNDSRLDRVARCWQRMTHASGDSVSRGDCVLLKASTGNRQQPFVARVASLWENPDDGEMMVSLVWYYRPEHTEKGREPHDAPDEVFASRHRDANSVACIEDKCYVLTYNEYCRYRKRLKAAEEGVTMPPPVVPPLPAEYALPSDHKVPPGVAPELVLFCRKIYDFRTKKIVVPNK
ncbi:uncharacterized protein LOC126372932 isoform X2 [Pectinophora gossypiella]|uniref:uncharacterized protein LOC126372932 isoform X2 n=1 Tax=Pectinophora gossypiella TaxID=13191 RepID=UPI00214EC123|nr:uncharacterized protein LOC126372932 isoform X2 [Pectinophora gossypiella]